MDSQTYIVFTPNFVKILEQNYTIVKDYTKADAYETDFGGVLVDHDNFYEFIFDYENCEENDDDKHESIEMGTNVFVELIFGKNGPWIDNILFIKTGFDFNSVIDWLERHSVVIVLNQNNTVTIENARAVDNIVRVYGYPLALITEGTGHFEFERNGIVEVTEEYVCYSRMVRIEEEEEYTVSDILDILSDDFDEMPEYDGDEKEDSDDDEFDDYDEWDDECFN